MIQRAANAYLDYRAHLTAQSKHTAEALMRTALVMSTNFDYQQGDITDHEYEQRLVFIQSADIKALRNELLS